MSKRGYHSSTRSIHIQRPQTTTPRASASLVAQAVIPRSCHRVDRWHGSIDRRPTRQRRRMDVMADDTRGQLQRGNRRVHERRRRRADLRRDGTRVRDAIELLESSRIVAELLEAIENVLRSTVELCGIDARLSLRADGAANLVEGSNKR
jgi:hypothetical protein